MDKTKLSKTISHALRHEPWLFELEMNSNGWVIVNDLLSALGKLDEDWKYLNECDLSTLIDQSAKKRFEIINHRIRAFYGHSVKGLLKKEQLKPPEALYHGTSTQVADSVNSEGLRPMNRQYVHLSTDTKTALEVGRRKSKTPVIYFVDSLRAHQEGVVFYFGNEKVWLADNIPPQFLSSGTTQGHR